ncbi:peptidoglycan DD-metalloendopeptidase family protein [Zestomonas thermotolerans]|uniref:peptidoglycan DD-metalloendopeptidase family protein n=1 Tax=Zestomonas thermotolerans TaxID=157784 RepID=UPI000482BE29|nr:peptidoglycan DD-metalloendopeptidase family protein [Pseudomonas thermotolerans]
MRLVAIQQGIRVTSIRGLVGGAVLSAVLAACSSPSGQVQVVDRTSGGRAAESAPRQPVSSGQYVVQRGDTLYSIAFRYGWDWKALAARNNIAPPYIIRVGQVIRFDGRQPAAGSAVASRPASSTANTLKPASSMPANTTARTQTPTQQKPSTPAPAATPAAPAATASSSPANVSQPSARSASGWLWPANGTLISRFASNGSLNKGIDIAGELGQPVFAASDGSVVYAGSGLRGYGELVIIKHSDTYVSAYGHNRRLLVREGQQVKAGQTIAEMGSTGTDRVKLHFEIRRQGKPVDPLQYLPKR